MANASSAPEPRTDLFQKAQKNLNTNPPPRPQIVTTSQKTAGVAVAIALLGGAAFTATQFVGDTPVPAPDLDSNLNTDIGNTVTGADSLNTTLHTPAPSVVQPPLAQGQNYPVTGGTITPGKYVAIAHNVNDDMSFKEAYVTARHEVGGGEGIFTWHKQVYNTYTREEWRDLSLQDRQTFLHNVGFKPTQQDTPQGEDHLADGLAQPAPSEPEVEPEYVETYVDGKYALGVDTDGDGIVDELYLYDEQENILLGMFDESGNEALDTVAQLDTITLEPIKTAVIPVDDQEEITMTEMEEWHQEPAPPVDLSNEVIDEEENIEDEQPDEEETPDTEEGENENSDDDGYLNQDGANGLD